MTVDPVVLLHLATYICQYIYERPDTLLANWLFLIFSIVILGFNGIFTQILKIVNKS